MDSETKKTRRFKKTRSRDPFSAACLDTLKAKWALALRSAREGEDPITEDQAAQLEDVFVRRRCDVAGDLKGAIQRHHNLGKNAQDDVDWSNLSPVCTDFAFSKDDQSRPIIRLTVEVRQETEGRNQKVHTKVFSVNTAPRRKIRTRAQIEQTKTGRVNDTYDCSFSVTKAKVLPEFCAATRAALEELLTAAIEAHLSDDQQDIRAFWGEVLLANVETLATDISIEAQKQGFEVDKGTSITLYPDLARPTRWTLNGILMHLKPMLGNEDGSSIHLAMPKGHSAMRTLTSAIGVAIDRKARTDLPKTVYPEFVDQLENSFDDFAHAMSTELDIPEDTLFEVTVESTDGPMIEGGQSTLDLTLSGRYGLSWNPAEMADLRSATFRVSVPHFSITDADNMFLVGTE